MYKQTAKKILGWALIIFGLAAFFTPLTPGAWLLFVGAELVGIKMLSRKRLTEYYRSVRARLRQMTNRS